jgi:hypothetical protein
LAKKQKLKLFTIYSNKLWMMWWWSVYPTSTSKYTNQGGEKNEYRIDGVCSLQQLSTDIWDP